jgi:hypothetical protein
MAPSGLAELHCTTLLPRTARSCDPTGQVPSSRYVLERELGRGGMATVYLGLDRKHERRVAIKVLHAELAAVLGTERFVQEIRVIDRLGRLRSGGGAARSGVGRGHALVIPIAP